MSRVTFSVPEEVKRAFDEAFEGEDKSAIIAALMREAVARAGGRRPGAEAFARILARRNVGPKFTDAEIRAAREVDRP